MTHTEETNWFDRQAIKFEEKRFFQMTIFMTAQSCWGSIAAMLTLKHDNYFLLAIVAALTMSANSAFIAQSPPKWCLSIFYGSVFVNLLIIIFSLLS